MLLHPLLPLLLTANVAVQEPGSSSTADTEQVLSLALFTEPAGFDPVRTTQTVDGLIQQQVFECLTEFDYQAGTEEVRGLLAKSWEVSDDGLTWTFRLHEDAAFHDPFEPPLWPSRGRPLVAQDVLYSWLRMADARTPGEGYWAMDGILLGLEDFREATAALDPQQAERAVATALEEGIPGIQVLDDHTLQLRLVHADPRFVHRLATPHFQVYPREAVETEGRRLLDHPVGSGPFRVETWLPGQTLHLSRVHAWRGQEGLPGAGGQPAVDRVEISTIRNPSLSVELFASGGLDRLTLGSTAIRHFLEEDYTLKEEFRRQGMVLHPYRVPDVTMICFGMRDPAVGHRHGDEAGNRKRRLLRRALALAFPDRRWAETIRGSAHALPARNFLPPPLPGREDLPACSWNRRDLDRARELLAEAGHPQGKGLPKLEFLIGDTGPMGRAIGDLYRTSAAEIGIDLEPVLLPYREQLERIRSGQGAVFLNAWVFDWSDPALILQTFFGPFAGTETNLSSFRDPEYDNLFRALRAAEEGPERRELTRKLLAILDREVPGIPVDHRQGWLLTQPWLEEFKVHPFALLPIKHYRVAAH